MPKLKFESYFSNLFFFPASPDVLGWQRFLFFIWLFISVYSSYGFLFVDGLLGFPKEVLYFPLIARKLGLDLIPKEYAGLLYYGFLSATFLCAIGFCYRISSFVCFIFGFYIFNLAQAFGSGSYSTGLPLVMLAVWCLVPAQTALSIDSYLFENLKKTESSANPSWQFTWGSQLAKILTVLFYFFAGIQKINFGENAWIFSDNLKNHIILRHFFKTYGLGDFSMATRAALYLISFPLLLKTLAFLIVALEALSPLALISRFAKFFIWAWLLFHISAGIFVNEKFIFFYCMFSFWIPIPKFLQKSGPNLGLNVT